MISDNIQYPGLIIAAHHNSKACLSFMPGPRKRGPEEMPDAGPHLFTVGQNLLHWIRSIISWAGSPTPTQSRQGVVVQPNEKYVRKLIELYDLRRLKSKATPEHIDLVKENKSKELGPAETKRFRSGSGSILYLAQDRIDIQYASKCLASSMSKPTTQALKCLKHLVLYLSGTAARATLLPYTSVGTRLITQLNGSVDMEITQEAGHVLEAYSDSDWGSLKTPEKARRKSTSSGIIVLNGIQVLSLSRTQKATASSSCEAELYALSGTCGEAILVLAQLDSGLTGEESDV